MGSARRGCHLRTQMVPPILLDLLSTHPKHPPRGNHHPEQDGMGCEEMPLPRNPLLSHWDHPCPGCELAVPGVLAARHPLLQVSRKQAQSLLTSSSRSRETPSVAAECGPHHIHRSSHPPPQLAGGCPKAKHERGRTSQVRAQPGGCWLCTYSTRV